VLFQRIFVIQFFQFTQMTQLLLEVPQQQDLEMLLSLFKRLNIKVLNQTQAKEKEIPLNNDAEAAFILAGLPPKQNFEAFVQEFEESRRDKPLPLREN
jgi:hypothetical protein